MMDHQPFFAGSYSQPLRSLSSFKYIPGFSLFGPFQDPASSPEMVRATGKKTSATVDDINPARPHISNLYELWW